MVVHKKPKNANSVFGQLGGLAKDIGIEVVSELKETGKEMVGLRKASENNRESQKDWAEEWLKDKDPNKPELSDKTGKFSPLDVKNQLKSEDQKELKQVQAKLSQMYKTASSKQESRPVYDKLWQEEEQKKQEAKKQAASKPADLMATGSKRRRGDWRAGAKRKRQATPQELNRAEFQGNKG
jgi:hypothetical protein